MSGVSVSSFGSAHGSSGGKIRPNAGGEEDHIFDEPHTIQLGIFGVLYTVSKEKRLSSFKFAFFRLFLDFLQLWLLVVNPSYGWAINASNKAWGVVSFIQLNSFLSARGYTFFLVSFYVYVGLLGLNLALSGWVAYSFSNNRFEYVWPIQFLRWFGLIFYQILDIATLTLLLVALDCDYFEVPGAVRFRNQEFPHVVCWSIPHIIHVTVSISSIVLFIVMATCMVLSEMELNPLTRNFMAVVHTRDEGLCFAIKTTLTITSVILSGSLKALSLVYLALFVVLSYTCVMWVPFVHSIPNYVRCASYSMVTYGSVLLVVLAFGPSEDMAPDAQRFRKRVTLALWIGMAPAAVAGAILCHMRLRHIELYVVERFRDAAPGTNSRSIYRFTDAREVEIAARCCRCWEDEDTVDTEAVALSEQIIKAGMMQLPQDPQMIILYSSFLIDVQGSYQSGYTQLQNAKKQPLGPLQHFAIFSREQEHIQKASGANSGDAAVDLVTVKAAERAYRSVLVRHASSARIVRLYGKFLETVKFDPWAAAKWYTEADKLEEEAEHSKEAMQLGGIEALLLHGTSGHTGLSAMEGLSFICINAQGQIQVASPEMHTLLGYGKAELKGRDLGIIMPHPFSERHTDYVRQYVHTGISTMMGKQQEVMVVTKARKVVQVHLHVTRVSGLNEDSVFLGMIEPLPAIPDDARLWILGNGRVVAADGQLCDWLGYDATDLAGQLLEELLVEKEAVRDGMAGGATGGDMASAATAAATKEITRGMGWLRRASLVEPAMQLLLPVTHGSPHIPRGSGGGELQAGISALPPLVLPRAAWRHKFCTPLEFDTFIHPGAIGSVQMHSVILRRCANVQPSYGPYNGRLPDPYYHDMLLVVDHQGHVLHATAALAAALGRSVESIRAGVLDLLIPEPASVIHGPWLQELSNPQSYGPLSNPQLKPPPYSCRSGLAVSLSSYSELLGFGVKQFTVSVVQRLAEGGGSKIHVASLTPRSLEEAIAERRMKLTLDLQGTIIDVDSATPTELFGTDPRGLLGSCISQLVDLFEQDGTLYNEAALELQNSVAAFDPRPPQQQQRQQQQASVAGIGGKSVGAMDMGVDVPFGPCGVPARAGLRGGADGMEAAFARRLSRLLLHLAKRSRESTDCSWRVGVKTSPDAVTLGELRQLAAVGALGPEELALAAQLTGTHAVPAVMRLRLVPRRQSPLLSMQSRRQHHHHHQQQQQRRPARLASDSNLGMMSGGAGGGGGGGGSGSGGGPGIDSADVFHGDLRHGVQQHLLKNGEAGMGVYRRNGGGYLVAAVQPAATQAQPHNNLDLVSEVAEGARRVPVWQRLDVGGYGGSVGSEAAPPSDGRSSGRDSRSSGLGNTTNVAPYPGPMAAAAAVVAAPPPPFGRSQTRNNDVRLVLPSPVVSRNSYLNGFGGGDGFQLQPATTDMRTPPRLGAAAPVGSGGSSSGGGASVVRRTSLETSSAHGVWAPVAAAAAADHPWGLGRGGGGGGGGPTWQRAVPEWMGPVAEATEHPDGCDPAACTLNAEDEAVLEQLTNSLDEAAVQLAKDSLSGTLAAAVRGTAPLTRLSPRSTPPGVSLEAGSPAGAGATALAAAVAAAVERANATRLATGSVSMSTAGSRSVNVTPRPSFTSTAAAVCPMLQSPVAAGASRGPSYQWTSPCLQQQQEQLQSLSPPLPQSEEQQMMSERPSSSTPPPPPPPQSPPRQYQPQTPFKSSSGALATSLAPPPPAARSPPSQSPSRSVIHLARQHVGPYYSRGSDRPSASRQSRSSFVAAGVASATKPSNRYMQRGGCGGSAAAADSAVDSFDKIGMLPAATAFLDGDALPPEVSAAAAAAGLTPPSLVFELELWRADLLSGVLEVDDQGKVLRADGMCPLGQAGLVLGTAQAAVTGTLVSELLTLPAGGVSALLDTGSPRAAAADSAIRGALKKRAARAARLGGTTVVTVRHQSDGCAMHVQLGFQRWLYDGDVSGLMPNTRRAAGLMVAAGADTAATAASSGGSISNSRGMIMPHVTSLGRVAAARCSGGTAAAGAASPPVLYPVPNGVDLASNSSSLTGAVPAAVAVAATTASGGCVALHTEMPSDAVPRDVAAAAGEPPPPLPPYIDLPLASPSLRIAVLRSGHIAANGTAPPPRLSSGSVTVAGPVADVDVDKPRTTARFEGSAEVPAALSRGFSGAAASSPVQLVPVSDGTTAAAFDPDSMFSNVSVDTAPERGGGGGGGDRGTELSISNPRLAAIGKPMGNGLSTTPVSGSVSRTVVAVTATSVAASPSHPPQVLAATLGQGQGPEVQSPKRSMMRNVSKCSNKMKDVRHTLVRSWALQPALRLRWRTLAAVGLIVVVHTVTFALLLAALVRQKAAVGDLHSVAMAALKVHEIATKGRTLAALYSGNSYVPGLPRFGDPLSEALSTTYSELLESTKSMKDLHLGVYLGFRSLRRISASYGLRSIWDDPLLNVTLYYDLDDPNYSNLTSNQQLLRTASAPGGNNGSSSNTSTINGTITSAAAIEVRRTTFATMGLWDAGNFYLSMAFDLVNNGPNVTARGANFSNWSSWRSIHDNGVSVIFPAYLATLDSLVELTVAASRSIYRLQLIVLCLEGGLLCILMCVYMWIIAHQYSHKRHNLYGVFLQIPIGVTRGLANMSLNLEASNQEEDSDDDLTPDNGTAAVAATEGGGGAAAGPACGGRNGGANCTGYGAFLDGEGVLTNGAYKGAAAAGGGERRGAGQRCRTSFKLGSKVIPGNCAESLYDGAGGGGGGNFSIKSAGGGAAFVGTAPAAGSSMTARLRAVSGAVVSLVAWRRRARVAPDARTHIPSPVASSPIVLGGAADRTKRRLTQSHKLAYWLVAPFIVWGAAIIAVNLVGYYNLKALTAPIATLNIVNVVLIRFHRVQYFVLEVAAAWAAALCQLLKPVLARELAAWRLEYSAMLYGSGVVPNQHDDVHFRLATTGVVFGGYTQPAELLYHTGSCLCADSPSKCQPPDSPYYQATRNGLDVLMKSQFLRVESLVTQPAESSGLNSTEFGFLWSTGSTDTHCGLMKLNMVYLRSVLGSYSDVIIQQIVMFCIAWVWGVLFLLLQLRPIVRKAQNEMRRVAELLSQLPPEVDCEALVAAVVLGLADQQSQAGRRPAGAGGSGGKAAAAVATCAGGAYGSCYGGVGDAGGVGNYGSGASGGGGGRTSAAAADATAAASGDVGGGNNALSSGSRRAFAQGQVTTAAPGSDRSQIRHMLEHIRPQGCASKLVRRVQHIYVLPLPKSADPGPLLFPACD
ncbi:hypothetical protein VOLCADRAFT_89940 [Volvox carteri f. nagariensis]|uniref:PAS domain-containing protein n=1 Tax=Volvox carteri f. nagariensis TaxID=3068 RepID=D8TT24_VOLCA|nr:uncharacterized protein VOLCADRAFT_89940 [Volvox carteri f. nagariensis]EFJ49581.1 hypothetical protein VOLCADRAFT_89940 [Volvox carteri f. nagariensis]|eukprot:XP_002949562.1 hypothetical protein VOLCADRAFT_89940 [Volvox carteri f. nagariensis]